MTKNQVKKYVSRVIVYILPFITIIVAVISYSNSSKAVKMSERENAPSFRIIQNLWTKNPYYELVNEASSKLDRIPSPSYLMFIPSKVYFDFGEERNSIVILTPISYDSVVEQIVQSETKSSIVKSTLTPNFFAKKGILEVIYGEKLKLDTENFSMYVDTMPFLVIISQIDYEYNKKYKTEILLSTPILNEKITKNDYRNIQEYLYDNAALLEVAPNEKESIYQTVHQNVEGLVTKINDSTVPQDEKDKIFKIFGGKEDGYGFVLKKLNQVITPNDPMEDYISEQQDSSNN
ncbi:hypothetical protein [Enterococcus sp. DIV1420a]|uniref:hypothetical protein n=1 Tax=Enterococcus sp. DIV1420a TaxID=2774672 RepID=UPI003F276A0D